MGIYTNGDIYGIRIVKICDDESVAKILFERKDVVIMSRENIQEARIFYERFDDKQNLIFLSYIEYSTTYGKGMYKSWSRLTLDKFLQIIGV